MPQHLVRKIVNLRKTLLMSKTIIYCNLIIHNKVSIQIVVAHLFKKFKSNLHNLPTNNLYSCNNKHLLIKLFKILIILYNRCKIYNNNNSNNSNFIHKIMFNNSNKHSLRLLYNNNNLI